ncbi:hypothetical protein [Mammaliicoccus sciuri]|uniref:Phage protein n=1 Tax=Mammaliicoccus sciuri TaxID=1296 RepID=A0ABT7HVX9_MAMSC|nr:hypothetical protein [Mammaliicoccus sciuri]MDL0112327.1 hypothetical protein [Mammaliicoccus sciuri]MDL0116239.1 hypothetical protein [Mammaliicoccus sciuri]
MAYEYESDVVSELGHLGMEYNSNAHYEMADEVGDVYAKAKALDKVITIVEDKEEFYSNEFIEAVVSAVDEFIDYELEDK